MPRCKPQAARKNGAGRGTSRTTSFAREFDAPAWKQHLESIRVSIPVSTKSAEEVGQINRLGETTHLIAGASADPTAISAAWEDFLLINTNEDPDLKEPVHPVFALFEFLDALGLVDQSHRINVKEFARRTKVPAKRLFSVLRCEAPITPGLSRVFSSLFGTSEGYWSNLQKDYDLDARPTDD